MKKYTKNRLIEKIGDVYIITPDDDYERIPINCPVCDSLFCSKEDEEAWHKFQCCEWCANSWAYSLSQKWNDGWRPSREEIERRKAERMGKTISFFGS